MRLLAVLVGLGLFFAGDAAQAGEKVDPPRSKTADLESTLRWERSGHRFVINVLGGDVRFKGMSFKDLDGPLQRPESTASMARLAEALGRRTAERGPEAIADDGVSKIPILFYADRAQPWSIVGNVMRAVRTANFPFRRFQLAYTDEEQDRLIEFVESGEQRLDEVARVPVALNASVEDVATKIDQIRESGIRDFVLDDRRYQFAPRQLGTYSYGPFQYARGKKGQRELRVDLSVPEGVTNPPLVVSILHESQWSSLPTYRLSAQGLATASFVVHGSKDAPFPVSIHLAKAAIRWLRAHAKKYGYDASRIGVLGVSEAGHLAALLGTSDGVTALEGSLGEHTDVASRVQAVIDIAGCTYFADTAAPVLGGTPEHQTKHAKVASPMTHATKDDAPFLIIDTDVKDASKEHSEPLHAALRAAGVDTTLHIAKGTTSLRDLDADKHWSVIEAFFVEHLKPKPAAPARDKK